MFQFLWEERGTAAMEYALLVSLLGMAIVGGLQILGGSFVETFATLCEGLLPVQSSQDQMNTKL